MVKVSEENEKKISKSDVRDKYFIKDLENITGIKAHTIRIWEQRYKILKPKRTDTAVRYYEEDDLKFMLNVAILNQNGYKISKLAKLSREEIAKKCLTISETSAEYGSQINALSSAMLEFDEREFNKILSINILKMNMENCMIDIIFPFLSHVGVLWSAGSIHPAHEHFITNLIRQRLYVSIDNLAKHPSVGSEKFLLFVPSGEPHDIGLLFANYILRARGFEVIYLGTGMPIEDLNNIFKVHNPEYIFTSLTSMNSELPTQIYINAIARSWPNKNIYITGPQVNKRKDLEMPTNVVKVENPSHFMTLVDDLVKD